MNWNFTGWINKTSNTKFTITFVVCSQFWCLAKLICVNAWKQLTSSSTQKHLHTFRYVLPRINFYGNNFLTVFIEFPVYNIHLMSAPEENGYLCSLRFSIFPGTKLRKKLRLKERKNTRASRHYVFCALANSLKRHSC